LDYGYNGRLKTGVFKEVKRSEEGEDENEIRESGFSLGGQDAEGGSS